MPGISGFEVLERIRDMSNVPILMLTAKDDSTSKVKGLRAGADDYLTKPFEMEEFFARYISTSYSFADNLSSSPDNSTMPLSKSILKSPYFKIALLAILFKRV